MQSFFFLSWDGELRTCINNEANVRIPCSVDRLAYLGLRVLAVKIVEHRELTSSHIPLLINDILQNLVHVCTKMHV